MPRKLSLIVLLILFVLFAQISFAQIGEAKTETKSETEISAELKKQAVEFLRESAGEVGNLRTLENRISFSSEMASLMWFHDEKEARQMINSVTGDFKQLIMQYDAQINSLGVELPENQNFYGGMFGSPEPDGKTNLLRKLSKAMVPVRQIITLSIAEHDPQLALNFYQDSLQALSNAAARKRFESQNDYFESQLINRIAENHPAKALELGRKSLAKQLNHTHIELLKKLYAKNADKGAEFGADIARKLKSEKIGGENFYMFGSFLSLGAENFEAAKKDGKKPMFAEQDLRDLTEIYAQAILQNAEMDDSYLSAQTSLIEKFAPGRAVQIRAKIKTKNARGQGSGDEYAAIAAAAGAKMSEANAAGEAGEKNEQEEMMKNLQNLGEKKLPKEEREKVVGQARKIIASLPNKQAKILALSGLAAQVAKLGDKELAGQIMTDAQSLTNPQPKNYLDFMEQWLVASGMAATDAEKAFPILEDTINRANDTLAAFVKVGEFIDVSGEMIEDGEVQVGSFGGSMVRELTGALGQADATLINLARADFKRTKDLTDRFERREVRILAKMLVLRAVLGDKNKTVTEEN